MVLDLFKIYSFLLNLFLISKKQPDKEKQATAM